MAALLHHKFSLGSQADHAHALVGADEFLLHFLWPHDLLQQSLLFLLKVSFEAGPTVLPLFQLFQVVLPQLLDEMSALRNQLLQALEPLLLDALVAFLLLRLDLVGSLEILLVELLFLFADHSLVFRQVVSPISPQLGQFLRLLAVSSDQLLSAPLLLLLDLKKSRMLFVLYSR